MTRQIQVPLATNTAEQDISGVEKLVNLYPRTTTGEKYAFNVVNAPGLAVFATLPTAPVLGMHSLDNRAFAVTATRFYEIFADGTFTDLGAVQLSGQVVMEDNGIQVVAVDGNVAYYYDVNEVLVSEITSEGFYPSSHVAFQDGYFIFNRTNTQQFFISKLFSIEFDAIDFASAEGQPDNLVALLSDHRELFLFGAETIEVWYNSGAAAFPFERNQSAFVEKGCAAPYSVAKQNNTVYFVGSDLSVYAIAGYTPVRISTHIVDVSLRGVSLADASAYVYQEEGHLFYVLTIPDNNITWCYDITTAAWHIKQSHTWGRHETANSIFFDNKTLAGDFNSGRIFHMTREVFLDDTDPIVREMVLPTIDNGREYLSINSLELDMETGIGSATGQASNPVAMLQLSKDSGKTYGSIKLASLGKQGEFFRRVRWYRFGRGRQFVFKITISDPVSLDFGAAFVEVN